MFATFDLCPTSRKYGGKVFQFMSGAQVGAVADDHLIVEAAAVGVLCLFQPVENGVRECRL